MPAAAGLSPRIDPRGGREHRRLAPVLCLLLLCAGSPAAATRVRPINLEELTDLSNRIFSGRVVEVREMEEPRDGRPILSVKVEVKRAVKGEVERTVIFRQRAGADARSAARSGVIGMPRYRVGEEVILFLATEGSSGLTSPLGLGQGKFVIRDEGKGRRYAVNEFGNRTLFTGLSPQARQRLGTDAGRWRSRQPVPPEALLDMVERLKGRP